MNSYEFNMLQNEVQKSLCHNPASKAVAPSSRRRFVGLPRVRHKTCCEMPRGDGRVSWKWLGIRMFITKTHHMIFTNHMGKHPSASLNTGKYENESRVQGRHTDPQQPARWVAKKAQVVLSLEIQQHHWQKPIHLEEFVAESSFLWFSFSHNLSHDRNLCSIQFPPLELAVLSTHSWRIHVKLDFVRTVWKNPLFFS